jgi:antirestriction protein ArdC
MARLDFRKSLTERLIGFMEEHDALPWQKGWEAVDVRPFNPASRAKYKGGNVINLIYGAIERQSDDPRWMTFKQANAAGYSIAKGAKAESVEYWDWSQPKSKSQRDQAGGPAASAPDEDNSKSTPFVFYAMVFNGRDIVGLPEIKREMKWQPNELAEKLIAATGAQIEHRALSQTAGGRAFANAAYFDNRGDKIVMPPRESFETVADYYATQLHELAHWTGHATRLDRSFSCVQTSSPEYAKEELRAEIASMHLTSMLGIEGDVRNHARYASRWIEVLKNDKHEIFHAAKDAEKIVEHIFNYAPELKAVVDSVFEANALPKDAPASKRDSGIKAVPNFTPATPEPIPAPEPAQGTGKNDPRWGVFESAVRGEAKKFNISDSTVEFTFDGLETTFTALMDSAQRNGYTVDDMRAMFIKQLVEEMRANSEREQQWEKFDTQVRKAADGILPPMQVELKLKEVYQQYQRTLHMAGANGLDIEDTNKAVREVIFGKEGRRPITPEFIKERFLTPIDIPAAPIADAELPLTPTGGDVLTLGDTKAVSHAQDDEVLVLPAGGESLSVGDAQVAVAADVDDELLVIPAGSDGLSLHDAVPSDMAVVADHGANLQRDADYEMHSP